MKSQMMRPPILRIRSCRAISSAASKLIRTRVSSTSPPDVLVELRPELTRFCDPPWHQLTIGADGQLFPCCVTIDNVGNIHDSEDPNELLNGPAFREYRRRMLRGPMPEGCKRCNNAHLSSRDELLRQVARTKMQQGQFVAEEPVPAPTPPDPS